MGNNLIAISGKINSGKDTVGKIIQYLTLDKEVFAMTNADIVANLEYNGYCASKSNWQIKKFADKLKDIVCILLGCTREQLEDREFKETPLPPEWNRTIYQVVSKDRYKNVLWQGFSKEDAQIELDFYDGAYSNSEVELVEKIHKPVTPRLLMQLLGTEAGRNIIHPNIWVNALFVDYKKEVKQFGTFVDSDRKDPMMTKDYPNWIITDARFPNELQAVKDRGGITIRVNRPIEIIAQHQSFLENHPANHPKNIIIGEHPSETALDNAEFDFVIDNNKDIEHLVNEVKSVLEKLNLC